MEREVIYEIKHEDADLGECTQFGPPYSKPEGRIRYLHTIATTENYIIIPETSYMYNPCDVAAPKEEEPFFLSAANFEKDVVGR